MTTNLHRCALLLAAALASACATVQPARMQLPAGLETTLPAEVTGLSAGRNGNWAIGPEGGSFQRGRDRLELFQAVSIDRAPVRYAVDGPGGRAIRAACIGRQTGATAGLLDVKAPPFSFSCEWTGSTTARLTLNAAGANTSALAERQGRFESGNVVLELRSVHHVQGSRLPLEAPIGYVLRSEGRAVGAVELNGTRPRLWRPAEGTPLREPVTLAALALALLWDPAAAP